MLLAPKNILLHNFVIVIVVKWQGYRLKCPVLSNVVQVFILQPAQWNKVGITITIRKNQIKR